ncbi:heme ABC exporter ATP-binding protein CcmA [Erythrobacter ani]|uniref:Heme ABC exporter ATP-binding protein CcmA n=1 Tax=Erythrobacter ani TaxID=2827235 RepID=A0ABS6SIN7_9SPHN|nr:heme ABC exporter ATP-binding protein CcmA [Erythrobacter ani]MBV7264873.1 heme ABC exporter ATP-binding protein CcmA [Erythrobacter ani]
MQGSATPSLSSKDLACRRGDRVLFRGLSFDLQAGDAMHVTGANGTGKTTLIRALAGLITPYGGSVVSEGAVGLLDERTGLDPDQPLGTALHFWESVDRCTDPFATFALLGLEPLLDVPVRYLSTGQRKRAGLAALVNRKVPIWLLDEPLSGLDARAIDQVTALISQHVNEGGIALIASHQPLAIGELTTLAIEPYVPAAETAS